MTSYISPTWRCKLKQPQVKQPQNHSQSLLMRHWPYHQRRKKTITSFNDHPSKWIKTGTVTPLEKFTETASLLISQSMSTIIDKKIAVRITNTRKSPYLIKKHTQVAEFSVVTPEQSKHIKPVDMAIFSMIPQGDPNLTAYLNELLRTNKPEQQDNTFWLPTPENLGKPQDHTPIQTRILNELNELKEK